MKMIVVAPGRDWVIAALTLLMLPATHHGSSPQAANKGCKGRHHSGRGDALHGVPEHGDGDASACRGDGYQRCGAANANTIACSLGLAGVARSPDAMLLGW
jgi:hypothetical protein